jgi:hypothetical protein
MNADANKSRPPPPPPPPLTATNTTAKKTQNAEYEVYYSGLKPNTEYKAVVTAVSPAGKSSGASVQVRTPADPNACPQSLGPVQSLTTSATTASQGPLLTAEWKAPAAVSNPSACIAGYQMQLLDERGNVLRTEYPFNPRIQLNTGLAYGTRYQVRVAAYPKTSSGGKGPLGQSTTVGMTTPPPPCPASLPAVVGLSSKSELVAAQSLAVRSNWQAPSGVASSCVKEYVWTLVEVSSGAQVARATTNGLQMYWSSSIKPSTKYRTRVIAVNPQGQNGAAASVEFVSGPYAVTGRK